jgi:glycosyltransferase involved in cell wall biosynthesis
MLKSVFAQTYSDWELLLIDDGSTDNTLDIVTSVKDSRIRLYRNSRNRGRAYSLNRITRLARGKYIARMDSDDLCSPTRIEKQIQLLEGNSSLDAVSAGLIYLDKDDNATGDHVGPTEHEDICDTPWRTFKLAHGALMAKQEFFQKTPYCQDIPFAVDYNLFLRSHECFRFGKIPEPLYYYRLDNSFKLKKQFMARYYSAAFLYKYFYPRLGHIKAIRYAGLQYLKFAGTTALFLTGQRSRLMARRCELLTSEKLDFHQNELQYIKSFKLPIGSKDSSSG